MGLNEVLPDEGEPSSPCPSRPDYGPRLNEVLPDEGEPSSVSDRGLSDGVVASMKCSPMKGSHHMGQRVAVEVKEPQ